MGNFIRSMVEFIGFMATIAVGPCLFLLYIFGMYEIIVDDHRYATKDVAIAVLVFPYPLWVGGKETYRFITTSAEDRDTEEKCLDASEALGMPRKSRLRFCECFVEAKDPQTCKSKIFIK